MVKLSGLSMCNVCREAGDHLMEVIGRIIRVVDRYVKEMAAELLGPR
jgi:hypothetical protein